MLNRANTAKINTRQSLSAICWLALLALLGSCSNGSISFFSSESNNLEETFDLQLSSVNIVSEQSGFTSTVFFNSSTSKPVSGYCSNAGSTGNAVACNCKYEWKEFATNGSVVDHFINSPITAVQPFNATCTAPSTFASIPDGTLFKISVVPGPSSVASFSSSVLNHLKGQSGGPSDFLTDDGQRLVDVSEYSCVHHFSKTQEVRSKINVIDSGNGEFPQVLASSFCARTSGGGGSDPQSPFCNGIRGEEESAQTYWFNLALSETLAGAFSLDNDNYSCPSVKESLTYDGTGGTEGGAYPRLRNYALFADWSSTAPLGIQSPSALSNDDINNTFCKDINGQDGAADSPAAAGSIASQCLGYAMRPEAGGSCPSFKDSSGFVRNTFRLRRYIANYPPIYQADGSLLPNLRLTNVVYVLDRPVQSNDPLNPHTMLGPKPCGVFSFFDHTGTVSAAEQGKDPANAALYERDGVPSYIGSNSDLWDMKNIDGTAFPNFDFSPPDVGSEAVNQIDLKELSCSAIVPITSISASGQFSAVRLATTHRTNSNLLPLGNSGSNGTLNLEKVYVRGFRKYAVHYEEDETFEACAPQANTFRDPPLHFAKAPNGNVSYCREDIPSQKDAIPALDPPIGANPSPGFVAPFTSHVAKNSASAACNATIPLSTPGAPDYPTDPPAPACSAAVNEIAGAAHHPVGLLVDVVNGVNVCSKQTCDRTIQATSSVFDKHSLLGHAADIEEMLRTDASYNCKMTYPASDNTPATGCCDPSRVFVTTGAGGPDVAHLENDQACLAPRNN